MRLSELHGLKQKVTVEQISFNAHFTKNAEAVSSTLKRKIEGSNINIKYKLMLM